MILPVCPKANTAAEAKTRLDWNGLWYGPGRPRCLTRDLRFCCSCLYQESRQFRARATDNRHHQKSGCPLTRMHHTPTYLRQILRHFFRFVVDITPECSIYNAKRKAPKKPCLSPLPCAQAHQAGFLPSKSHRSPGGRSFLSSARTPRRTDCCRQPPTSDLYRPTVQSGPCHRSPGAGKTLSIMNNTSVKRWIDLYR